MNKSIRTLLGCLILVTTSLMAEFDLAVGMIFQNQAPQLKEWIEFHKAQGVQHFYLYNNNSEDAFLKVLQPYMIEGLVTLIDWPYTYANNDNGMWRQIQFGAYMDCIRKYEHETKWLAIIDSDEYLFCPTGKKIPELLANYKDFGGLCVNWVRYGTSHIKEIPPGKWMVEVLTRCNTPDRRDRRFVKSIVQPRLVESCLNAHSFSYKEGKWAVNSAKEKVEGTIAARSVLNEIRLNHYWTGTETDFKKKKIPSRHKRRNEFDARRMNKMAKKCNAMEDKAILPLLKKVPEYSNFKSIECQDKKKA